MHSQISDELKSARTEKASGSSKLQNSGPNSNILLSQRSNDNASDQRRLNYGKIKPFKRFTKAKFRDHLIS